MLPNLFGPETAGGLSVFLPAEQGEAWGATRRERQGEHRGSAGKWAAHLGLRTDVTHPFRPGPPQQEGVSGGEGSSIKPGLVCAERPAGRQTEGGRAVSLISRKFAR